MQTAIKQRWVIGLILGLIALGILTYYLRAVLSPFITGAVLAYCFQPLIAAVTRAKISRGIASALVIVFVLLIFSLSVLVLIPLLSEDLQRLMKTLPDVLQSARTWLEAMLMQHLGLSLPDAINSLKLQARENAGAALGAAGFTVNTLIDSGGAALNFVTYCVLVPIVTFYLGRDWPRFAERFFLLFPSGGIRRTLRSLCAEFDSTLASFFRGQAIVCLFLAIFYSLTLWLAGLNYALLIGVITGILSFIPFIGSLFGLVVSVGLAFYQADSLLYPLIIAAIFGAGQFIEGNILSPRILGQATGLHPLWVIFALMAGGALFGFVGILLAVPVGALIGVTLRYGYQQYQESGVYHG